MTLNSPNTLLATFLAAHYQVCTPTGTTVLRIGRHSAALASLMRDRNANTVAILTAYNPDAQKADEKANQTAQEALQARLQGRGRPFLLGENYDPNGKGPAEPTCVVPGLDIEDANELAKQFRQLAFVVADARAVPELVWTFSAPNDQFTD